MNRKTFMPSLLIAIVFTVVLQSAGWAIKIIAGPPIVAVATGKTTTMSAPASSVSACIGQVVAFNAEESYDKDYKNDPIVIDEKCITYSWSYVKDGITVNLGAGSNISRSFSEPGTYTVKLVVSDDCGYNNDDDSSATVTVNVGEIQTLHGPDQCALCKDKNYTYTVDLSCSASCDDVRWTASGATPGSQIGGCSFTTTFIGTGSRNVVAVCGSSTKVSRDYNVVQPCTGANGTPQCVLTSEGAGSIGGCNYGMTTPDVVGNPYICFDCDANQWVVRVPQLDLLLTIKYDAQGKSSADGVISCTAAQSLKEFWANAKSQSDGGPGNPLICDLATAPYWSPSCAQVHEQTHRGDFCSRFSIEASDALSQVAALSRSVQYCSEEDVADIAEAASVIFTQLGANMTAWMEANSDRNAYQNEEECLAGQINAMCSDPSMEACTACMGF